jgi:hypothetical protein
MTAPPWSVVIDPPSRRPRQRRRSSSRTSESEVAHSLVVGWSLTSPTADLLPNRALEVARTRIVGLSPACAGGHSSTRTGVRPLAACQVLVLSCWRLANTSPSWRTPVVLIHKHHGTLLQHCKFQDHEGPPQTGQVHTDQCCYWTALCPYEFVCTCILMGCFIYL